MDNEKNNVGEEIASESWPMSEPQHIKDKKTFKIPVKTAILGAAIIAVVVLGYIFKGVFFAASIDGSLISRLSVIERLEKSSGKSVLDSLITEKLIANEAKSRKISVSDEEVNAEITKITEQVKQQGSTLGDALLAQGMTMEDLKKNITLQKKVEKMVADKIGVTDEEVAKYIADNKVELTAGQEEQIKNDIKESLKNQKLSAEANALVTSLKAKASIKYFVNY